MLYEKASSFDMTEMLTPLFLYGVRSQDITFHSILTQTTIRKTISNI